MTSNDNITFVENWLINAYDYMAMVNYPYPTSFLTPLPGYPVNFSCQAFADVHTDDDDETFFQALYKSAKIFYDYQNTSECNEIFDDSSDGQGGNE